MAVLALGFRALFSDGRVFLTCLFQGIDFLLRRILGPESFDEVDRLRRDRTNGFCPTVEIDFRHGGLVHALCPTVETKVCCLKSHLHKSVRREAHRGHEILSVMHEFERLKFILLDQISQPSFRKP